MTNPACAENETHILPLLNTQLALAGSLENLLQAEYRALLASDLATLAELVAQKHGAAQALEQSSLDLAQHTSGAPQEIIPQLGQEALHCWQQLGDAADRLRKQNLHNGALLNERQNRLRWVVERAGGEPSPLYTAHPQPGFVPGLSGRSLARA